MQMENSLLSLKYFNLTNNLERVLAVVVRYINTILMVSTNSLGFRLGGHLI